MKIQLILISILLFFSIGLYSQIDNTINKGTGILYFSGIPGTTPDTTASSYEAEVAMNSINGEMFFYDRDSTSWKRLTGIEKGFGDPSADPGIYAKTYVNLTDGSLWRWNGAIWVNAFASGGVSDGDKGDITVSGSGTVWTIDNEAVTTEKLESGEASPIANQFYGTNNIGTKGFHSIDTINTIGKVFRFSSDSMFLQAPTIWLSNSTQEVLSVDTDGVKILNGTGNNGATVLYGKDPITSKIVEVSDLTGFTGVGGGGGGGGGGAADSITFSTNYRRDTAIANVRAEMFLNSVIVAGEGSYYHSNGADFSVPNGNKDAQVYIQQAADLAVARGVSTVFMDGLFTVNDSINIKPTYNLTFLGGGRANTIIYTDSTIWVPITPVFGFDTANDTIQNLTFKDFSIRQPDNGNNGSLGNAGLIKNWDNGRIENLTFDNVDFRGSGTFNSIVNFTYKTETLGTFPTYGHILVKDSHMEMDGDGKDGQYGFHCKVPTDKMTFINSNFIISGTGFGANNYNSLAAYGMGNSLVVDGCDVICDTKGHSPLAASPFRNIRISNNYVRMFEPNNVEGLIEVERKIGHATSTTIDTVENFTITGNVMEMIDWETGGQTNYGVLITDRDGVGNPNTALQGTYTPVRHGTVSGNVIKNVQTGISMNYSENVVLSGNTMLDVVNRVDRGNTDRGDAIVANSEFGALFVDAVNEKLAIYDASTLTYRDLFGLGGNNEIIFNEVLTINNAIPRVDIGDNTTSVPLYLYDRIDINENGFNTLIGEEIDNVTGTNNVFQGYRTGRYATNSYNIGIGNLALGNASFTGRQNVAVGYGAATSFQTSENNVAVGYEPLFSSISGNNNVAIGYRSLNQLETSSNNVAIGYRSGYGEEGATNTFLGSFTGNTIGDSFVDGVVFLGYAVGQNNTQDNRLMIDNTNTETPLIDGDFTNDIVTINSILKIAPITAATASAITPANGMYIYVSNTDATFTTIGFWAYENGAWVDK